MIEIKKKAEPDGLKTLREDPLLYHLHNYCSELLETFRNEEDPKTPYVGILIWYLQTMVTALK